MLTDLHRQLHRIRDENTPVEHIYRTHAHFEARAGLGRSGARFYCPICTRWYRRFFPFGLRGRPNARCPGCHSLERHRFMWLHMTERLELRRRRGAVLHVAPEPCIRNALAGQPGVGYLGIDRFDDAAEAPVDLTDLPYADRAFDLVICSHVLEHIEDDRRAMTEIARVLRPGGHAIVLVPIDRERETTYEDPAITAPAARLAAFGHPYHVRVCGWDYGDRLRAVGLVVTDVHSTSMAPHKRRIHRINKTLLYDCRLP